MNKFSISDLEFLSGIKAATLRVWEKRYNTLQPSRSEGNTRYYDANELTRLLNVVGLLKKNYKISYLSTLSTKHLQELNTSYITAIENDTEAICINQLINSCVLFDEVAFTKLYHNAIQQFGLLHTYTYIVYPFLIRIGVLWQSDNVSIAQEHFVSNLIKKKLFASIDALPPPDEKAKKWVLLQPEDEFHDIALLMSYYILQKKKQAVIYLGANTPIGALHDILLNQPINYIFLSLVIDSNNDVLDAYIYHIQEQFPKLLIYISCSSTIAEKINFDQQIIWVEDAKSLSLL